MNRWFFSLVGVTVLLLFCFPPQQTSAQTKDSPAVVGQRAGNLWTIDLSQAKKDGDQQSISVPRVYASLRSTHFKGHPNSKVQVRAETEHWELRFKGDPPSDKIVLEFDSYPATLKETTSIKQLGDGTLTLPCSLGRTKGEKLRFEPQPHKNTIGFWTKTSDSVSWPITISKPGEFNIGLLQGAGNGCGGTAKISVLKNDQQVASLDYEVKVTGHFQNFVWQNAGRIAFKEPGDYVLQVAAAKIKKAALMDVRQIHLSPVPQKLRKKK